MIKKNGTEIYGIFGLIGKICSKKHNFKMNSFLQRVIVQEKFIKLECGGLVSN